MLNVFFAVLGASLADLQRPVMRIHVLKCKLCSIANTVRNTNTVIIEDISANTTSLKLYFMCLNHNKTNLLVVLTLVM